MKYSKRHYEDIAGVLRATRPNLEKDTQRGQRELEDSRELWLRVRNRFVELFKEDNPRFSEEKFIKATE